MIPRRVRFLCCQIFCNRGLKRLNCFPDASHSRLTVRELADPCDPGQGIPDLDQPPHGPSQYKLLEFVRTGESSPLVFSAFWKHMYTVAVIDVVAVHVWIFLFGGWFEFDQIGRYPKFSRWPVSGSRRNRLWLPLYLKNN